MIDRHINYAGPYVLAIKDMVLFSIFMPGLPDWEEAEDLDERITVLECEVTGALPSEVRE